MPTYDYVCDACGHAFEHFQGITEALLRACPECRKRKLRRLIGSGAGIIFKGSGFYETDYKRASKPSGSQTKDGGADGPGKDKSSKEQPGASPPDGTVRPSGAGKPAGADKPGGTDAQRGGDKPAAAAKPSGPAQAGKPPAGDRRSPS